LEEIGAGGCALRHGGTTGRALPALTSDGGRF
jgi:hypothetical protein